MSTNIDNKIESKIILDLYKIEPDSLLSFTFNFDILKYVITELIKKQKKISDEISTFKSELLQQKKNSNEIASDLLELKLSLENNIDIQQDIEEKRMKLNNELNNFETRINDKENKESILENELINEEIKFNNNFVNQEKIFIQEYNNDKENIGINKNNIVKNDDNISLKKEITHLHGKKISNKLLQGISEEIKTIINDIKNIKVKQLNLEKDYKEYKNDIEKKISKKVNDSIPNIENKIIDEIKLLQKRNNEKITKNINEIKEEFEKKNIEVNKKLSEAEITNKIISELKGNNDLLFAKVNTLNNNFSFYTKLKDFKENRDDTFEYIKKIKEDINKNVELLRRGFNVLKTQFTEHINDKTDHNNLDLLLKKFDIAQNMLYKFRDFQTDMEEKEKKRIVIDPNHFINKDLFNEFLKNEHKNFDEYKKEYINLKYELEELKIKEVGNKATLKDLKSLEENIYQRIEELKLSIYKRFVDKNTLNKNKKIMEMQTKQLIEENKKEEKKENWLLTKKPFGGHLCASCESFIGDLNPNTTAKYIPWNKYPQRDPQEKVFKIEGGVSTILNMFSTKISRLNNNNSKNNINSTSMEKSTNTNKTIIDDNNENRNHHSRNSANENQNNNDKVTKVNSFSGRFTKKKNYKIKSEFDDIENVNNLPMIPKSLKNAKKNNSSFNLINYDNNNVNNKNMKNMLKTLKSSKSTQKNLDNNQIIRNIQIEDDIEYHLNSKKNNLSIKNRNKSEEPKITKIIKKH